MSANRILFSICVPVRDDLRNLRQCLAGLKRQDLSGCEVIVCDDGSREPLREDDVADIGVPLTLVRQVGQGPSVARNHMAELVSGEYLFFVDADTVAGSDMLDCARRIVGQNPELDVFYGSYDDEPAQRSLISWYRNLLHHYTHHASSIRGESVSTFWCGCGVVRRSLYLDMGGLSSLYDKPSIEDIELGGRMAARGVGICVFPELQVKHLKHWTLRSWLHTDLYRRGVPWVRLMRARSSWESQLNFSWSQRLASLAALALVASVPLLAVAPRLASLAILVSLVAFLVPNRSFIGLVFRKRGLMAACAVVPLHMAYALICVMSVGIALVSPRLKLPPTPKLVRRGET